MMVAVDAVLCVGMDDGGCGYVPNEAKIGRNLS